MLTLLSFIIFFLQTRQACFLVESQGSLLPNCLWAFKSQVRMGEKGRTEYGCVTPSNWSDLAPEWLLYMEKWKRLHNHVRKLEESISWQGGSSYLEEFQSLALISQALSIWSMYGKEGCIDSAELKLLWDSASVLWLISKVNIPHWRVGAVVTQEYKQAARNSFPEMWFRLRLQNRVAFDVGCTPLPPTFSGLGSSPSLFYLLRERACTCILSQLRCYTTDSF